MTRENEALVVYGWCVEWLNEDYELADFLIKKFGEEIQCYIFTVDEFCGEYCMIGTTIAMAESGYAEPIDSLEIPDIAKATEMYEYYLYLCPDEEREDPKWWIVSHEF